jgi:hypothetical protein
LKRVQARSTFDAAVTAAAWIALAAVFVVSIVPGGWRPSPTGHANVERLAAFAVLALLFVVAYPRYWLRCLVLLLVAAFGFELLKALAVGRHPTLYDAIVKASGAIGGTVCGLVFRQLIPARGLAADASGSSSKPTEDS